MKLRDTHMPKAQRNNEIIAVCRNPNTAPGQKSVLDISWPPAQNEMGEYLEFGDTFKLKTGLLKKRMEFWDSLYSKITKDPVYK